MAVFESERVFRLSSFDPTHNQLIIRSDPDLEHETRIEIYFGNVAYMALRPMIRGITLRRASADEGADIASRVGLDAEMLEYLFLLETATPVSFVVSGRPSWREATRTFDDPSLFDLSQPWPPGADVSWGAI